ncbi:MAG: YHYH domain-containing protein [Parcubacteria group bacterium]|nr:YHYH domain-containing protein [Parcubacteria group bacterium]
MTRKSGVWPSIISVVQKITPQETRGNFILLIVIAALSVSFGPTATFAHPGRTDSSGCHTCRTNCTSWGLSYGEYHCHRSKGVPQLKEPVRSIRDQQITVPAPEYKIPKANETQSKTNLNSNKPKPAEVEKQGFFKRFFGWLFR